MYKAEPEEVSAATAAATAVEVAAISARAKILRFESLTIQ